MISYILFYIKQQMEFEKFHCFFVDFLRYSFRRIKVISTVVEREYTLDIILHIMTDGNLPKVKFKTKYTKINRGYLIITLLNSLRY